MRSEFWCWYICTHSSEVTEWAAAIQGQLTAARWVFWSCTKCRLKGKNIRNSWRRHWFETLGKSEILGGKNLIKMSRPAFWLRDNNKNAKNFMQHFKNILHQNEAYKTTASKQFVITDKIIKGFIQKDEKLVHINRVQITGTGRQFGEAMKGCG